MGINGQLRRGLRWWDLGHDDARGEGRYAGGRGKFYGDLAWLHLLRFLHRWEVNFAVGSFVI
ncbi:MAG: hypothetical protein QXI84_08310 [Thermofilaceae archaeon]